MNDIVVGIDRSDTGRRAAEAAAELATVFGVNLHLVMCVERGPSANFTVGSEHFHTDWLTEAEQFLTAAALDLKAPSVSRTVGIGDPAAMLCEEAERLHAGTIVVGNRRVQGLSRVLGSVAGDVIKRAPCHVLIAQTTARDTE